VPESYYTQRELDSYIPKADSNAIIEKTGSSGFWSKFKLTRKINMNNLALF